MLSADIILFMLGRGINPKAFLYASAAPMAGSMNMNASVFLRYDLGGAIGAITEWVGTLGRAIAVLAGIGAAIYFGFRLWSVWRFRRAGNIPRVTSAELAARFSDDILIADVRSHGYYDAKAERIFGSIRIEPNRLLEALADLPQDRDVYLYCSQNEATSQRVAELLNSSLVVSPPGTKPVTTSNASPPEYAEDVEQRLNCYVR